MPTAIIVVKREDLEIEWVFTREKSTVIIPPVLETFFDPKRRSYRTSPELLQVVVPYFAEHPNVGEVNVKVDTSLLFDSNGATASI